MKKPESIQVIGRRWFDRRNGNTYFCCEIYVNSEYEHTIPYEYGYGDQYIQSAFEWLSENGFIQGWIEDGRIVGGRPSYFCRENGIKLIDSVCDVARKRDLIGA